MPLEHHVPHETPQSLFARQRLLTRYRDPAQKRLREVITLRGASASVLLVDREAFSGGDPRLLAHLGADEPAENASIVCVEYLRRLGRGPLRCRRLAPAGSGERARRRHAGG